MEFRGDQDDTMESHADNSYNNELSKGRPIISRRSVRATEPRHCLLHNQFQLIRNHQRNSVINVVLERWGRFYTLTRILYAGGEEKAERLIDHHRVGRL